MRSLLEKGSGVEYSGSSRGKERIDMKMMGLMGFWLKGWREIE